VLRRIAVTISRERAHVRALTLLKGTRRARMGSRAVPVTWFAVTVTYRDVSR